jgi:uncharacterized phage-associated protein
MQADYEKITQLLNFFIRKNSNSHIQKLKAIKLIWAADRYHIRKYGRLVSQDEYCALPYGPVASLAKDVADLDLDYIDESYVEYINKYIERDDERRVLYSHKNVEEDNFSKTDLEALEFAWNEFGKFDGFKLAKISHDYPEWSRFKEPLESKTSRKETIHVEDFFENPAKLTELSNDPFAVTAEMVNSSKEYYQATS